MQASDQTGEFTLVDRARSGDKQALGELLERSRARLGRLAGRRMGRRLRNRLTVSDAVQSVFIEAVRRIDGFEGGNEVAFDRWLDVVLENKIKNRGRHYCAAKRRSSVYERRPEALSETPSRVIGEREELERAMSAVDELDERQRAVLLWRVEGVDSKEIARRLDTTSANVRILLCRARATLRERFDEGRAARLLRE